MIQAPWTMNMTVQMLQQRIQSHIMWIWWWLMVWQAKYTHIYHNHRAVTSLLSYQCNVCLRVGVTWLLSLNQKACSACTFFMDMGHNGGCGCDCGDGVTIMGRFHCCWWRPKMQNSFTSSAEVRATKWIKIQCVKYIILDDGRTKNHFCATNLMVVSHVVHSPFFQW